MNKQTVQIETWSGDFGKEYTDRNPQTLEQLESVYKQYFGVTRSQMNQHFLGDLDRASRILEVGCNVGSQLQALQNMGFDNLYGIELQSYAVELSKQRTKHINIIQGSGFDIPYKDNYFDLVYTSGVLIHISPNDIEMIIREAYRCSRRYIWGFEYFSDTYEEVNYRGNDALLSQTNFAQLYQNLFPDLKLIKKQLYPYLGNDNVDCMFLLEKQ